MCQKNNSSWVSVSNKISVMCNYKILMLLMDSKCHFVKCGVFAIQRKQNGSQKSDLFQQQQLENREKNMNNINYSSLGRKIGKKLRWLWTNVPTPLIYYFKSLYLFLQQDIYFSVIELSHTNKKKSVFFCQDDKNWKSWMWGWHFRYL